MSTFLELAEKEIDEVRMNDTIQTPADAWSRVYFSCQSFGDIIRYWAACKITQTEAQEKMKDVLVNISNLAQHSAESLGICVPTEVQEQISDGFREDCHSAVKWMADYIKDNMKRVRSTQLGGEDRFSVEFDASTIDLLFKLAKGEG